MSIARIGRSVSLTCAISLLGVACHKQDTIRPTEVPRLGGGTSLTAGSNPAPAATGDDIRVLTPDGRVVEVSSDYDLVVRTRDGREIRFDHPVLAEGDEGGLRLRASNLGETRLAYDDIVQVKARQFDGKGTAIAIVCGAVAVSLAVAIILLSTAKSDEPKQSANINPGSVPVGRDPFHGSMISW
jgi:hypothetical protein